MAKRRYGTFDAAVASLVLCSLPDPHAALSQMRRVLGPGGQLRFLEHVRADSAALRRVQDLLDATVWPHLAGGCHTGRDSAVAIQQAGFTITALERFLLPAVRTPVSFFIQGTAYPAASAPVTGLAALWTLFRLCKARFGPVEGRDFRARAAEAGRAWVRYRSC